jgi:hypothetical protein
MPNWNKVIVSGSRAHLIAVTASSQISINPAAASTEATLILGPPPAGGSGEGGQIALQPASGFTSASFIDTYQTGTTPYIRLLRGNAATTDALVAQWNLHTKQFFLPAYTSVASFSGTATALLAVNSSGDVITVSTGSGGGGGSGTVNGGNAGFLAYYPSTGTTVDDVSGVSWDSTNSRLAVTGSVIATANGAMYFRGGDDAEFWDINVANTVGIYGQQNADRAGLKLGSSGPTLFGSASKFGIGTITPTLGTLEINGNIYATSFTGSLQGTATTASYVLNAVSASFAVSSSKAVSSSFATTASYATTANQLTPGGTTGYIPVWSSNTQLGDSVIYEKLGSIGVGTGVVSSHPGKLTVNGSGTTALVVTGSSVLSGSITTTGPFMVIDALGVPSADFGSARLLRDVTGAPSIDYGNRLHYDASGTKTAINNRFRYLIASNGTTTVNWDDTAAGLRLIDKYTTSSVDWGNRILYDDGILFSGVPKDSINWNTRECLDVSTSQSISWGARRLVDSSGNAAVNWGAYQLADTIGNPALSWDAASSNNRQSLHAAVFMRTEIELGGGIIEQFSDMNSYSFYPEGRVIKNATIDSGVVDYNFVFLDTDGTWKAVDNASTRATKMLGVAFSVGGDNKILLDGHLPVNSANISDSPYVVGVDHGLPIYLSASFAATTTVPTATGQYVRILGHAYYNNTAPNYWVMNFSPDHTWVQL